jgi:hypothetical protein
VKLPWVSREQHEEITSQLREIVVAQAKLVREEKEERLALLEKYHALRVQGAQLLPALPDPPKSPLAELGPKSRDALRSMSVGLPATNRRAMETRAVSLHTQGLDDDQLAAAIFAGESQRNGNGRRQ